MKNIAETFRYSRLKREYNFLLLIIFTLTLFITGSYFNALVMKSNYNKMPVMNVSNFAYPNMSNDYEHFVYNSKDKIGYSFLADNYRITHFIFSIGDLLIILSLTIYFSLSFYKFYIYITERGFN